MNMMFRNLNAHMFDTPINERPCLLHHHDGSLARFTGQSRYAAPPHGIFTDGKAKHSPSCLKDFARSWSDVEKLKNRGLFTSLRGHGKFSIDQV